MSKIINDINELTPLMQQFESTLRDFAMARNIKYAITETYRSLETITEYYQRGRRGVAGEKTITNISPDNAAATSAHYNRCAFDLVLINNVGRKVYEPISDFKILGDYWVTLDPLCRWGGHWKKLQDLPHFEHIAYLQKN